VIRVTFVDFIAFNIWTAAPPWLWHTYSYPRFSVFHIQLLPSFLVSMVVGTIQFILGRNTFKGGHVSLSSMNTSSILGIQCNMISGIPSTVRDVCLHYNHRRRRVVPGWMLIKTGIGSLGRLSYTPGPTHSAVRVTNVNTCIYFEGSALLNPVYTLTCVPKSMLPGN
jgi:hypothetical protein